MVEFKGTPYEGVVRDLLLAELESGRGTPSELAERISINGEPVEETLVWANLIALRDASAVVLRNGSYSLYSQG